LPRRRIVARDARCPRWRFPLAPVARGVVNKAAHAVVETSDVRTEALRCLNFWSGAALAGAPPAVI